MNPAHDHNVAAFVGVEAAALGNLVAGGAGDNTEIVGPWVSRDDFMSAAIAIVAKATLAAAATLTIDAVSIEDANDDEGDGSAEYAAFAETLVLTGEAGGSTEHGALKLAVDLAGAKEFVRVKITPDLSAANTDVANVAAALVLGGARELPV